MQFPVPEYSHSANNAPERHPLIILVLLIFTILFFSLLGGGLIYFFGYLRNFDLQDFLNTFGRHSSLNARNDVRIITLINHLTTFLLPAVLTALFVYKRQWIQQLILHRNPDGINVVFGTLFIVFSFPLAQFIYHLNRQIPLPEWAMSMESSSAELLKGLLVMNTPSELIFNLVIIALIPAIGEELVFRGFVQKKLEAYFRNPILSIWVTAVIFSAIHLQMQGFFPRVLLGAILGYLLYWTNNLWIPIIAHFVNNAMQVLAQYYFSAQFDELEIGGPDSLHWSVTLISFLLVLGIGYYLKNYNEELKMA